MAKSTHQKYRILLKNCAFFARHGVYQEEGTLGQRFFVDAQLDVDPKGALEKDDIEGTVDYGAAFEVIRKKVTEQRNYLIESLALELAKALCEEFKQIERAKVTVRKPNAPVPGILDYVEVTIDYP